MTTVTLKVLPLRLTWRNRVYKRGDIVRYHSHFGYLVSDWWGNHNQDDLIDNETLERIKSNGWFKEVEFSNYWSQGTMARNN